VNKYRFLLIFFLLIVSCSGNDGSYKFGVTSRILGGLVSENVKLADSLYTYSDSTMHNYIDGGDKYFIDKGVRELSVAYYSVAGIPDDFIAELYRFTEPESAKTSFTELEEYSGGNFDATADIINDGRGAFICGKYYGVIYYGFRPDSSLADSIRKVILLITSECMDGCRKSPGWD